MLKFLTLSDLLHCRLVSRQWRDVGTKFLIKKIDEIEIKFQSKRSNSDVYELDENSMDEFLEMARNCYFKFTNFSFDETPMSSDKTKELLNAFGPSMTKLKLSYSKESTNINTKEFLDILTKASSLKDLSILSLPTSVTANPIFQLSQDFQELKLVVIKLGWSLNGYSNSFLEDIFQNCKFLKTLIVYGDSDGTQNILPMLSGHGSLKDFQELEITSVTGEMVTRLLDLKNAPIKRFVARCCDKPNQQLFDEFTQFINGHKETMERLELTFRLLRNAFIFPILKNLKYLSIAYCLASFDQPIIGGFKDVDYNKQLPNLVTLKLIELHEIDRQWAGSRYYNFDALFPVEATPLLSLKNLELPSFVTSKVLGRVGKMFPNVTHLKINTQQIELLTKLWTTWPLLVSLDIKIQSE